MAIASTGKWITLTHAGIKREGEPFAYFCETKEEAKEHYEQALRDYYYSQIGRLILWRETPQIKKGDKGWVVCSRLAIIDELNGTCAVSLINSDIMNSANIINKLGVAFNTHYDNT
jgi:hypothetical protein